VANNHRSELSVQTKTRACIFFSFPLSLLETYSFASVRRLETAALSPSEVRRGSEEEEKVKRVEFRKAHSTEPARCLKLAASPVTDEEHSTVPG
jgi:hypothetical protein